jgi:hypothetical protein
MGFWGGLFGGSDPTLNANIGKLGSEGDFSTAAGEGDVTAASKFYTDILNGDQTKEAQALAPEIGAIKGQAQQQKKSIAENGTRSGGTAAQAASIDDKVTGDITGLIGGLKTGAASGAAGLGTAEQGIGIQSQEEQDAAAQQRMKNWQDSILGSATTGAVNYAESFLPVAHGG